MTSRVLLSAFNEVEDPQAEKPPFRLHVQTGPEIAAIPDPPDSDLLLGPLVIRGGRTIIVGDTGHGKTTFALQMAAGILKGDEVLGYHGAGAGPILVIDLEQGIRSIKRSVHQAGLHDQDEALYVPQPDGLALDSDSEHLAELHRIIDDHRPVTVVLDPFYKAHRGDANEERAITDLMRVLDGLRAKFGFALILPAHPRKDSINSAGVRKLTIHDVAGSAAVTRGAEIVLAVERLSHGYARLRILKDRDSDLPVGEAWPLLFDTEQGFRLDPKEETTIEDLETRILGEPGVWRTYKEWARELTARIQTVRSVLDRLAATGHVEYLEGPPGRSKRAKCYRALEPGEDPLQATVPGTWEPSGTVEPVEPESDTVPTVPPSIRDGAQGTVGRTVPKPGTLSPPDERWLDDTARTQHALEHERNGTSPDDDIDFG